VIKGSEGRGRGPIGHAPSRVAGRPHDLGKPATWALAPSDFAFLWDECPRCFYNKVALKKGRPRASFSKAFGLIDQAMKSFYLGERSEELLSGMPGGVLGDSNRWVKSTTIVVPGCSTAFIIRGRVDALVHFDNQTTGVLDFKTSEPRAAHIDTYGRQLHSYALALENPAVRHPTTVNAVALLCFSPAEFEAEEHKAALSGDLCCIEVSRDDTAFSVLFAEVICVLEGPELPPQARGCPWCAWNDRTTERCWSTPYERCW